MSAEDTDVLLASLISLLEPNVPKHVDLLNTLVDCDGNVEAAARLLQQDSSRTQATTWKQPVSKKRKRTASGLDDWLSPARLARSSANSHSKKHTSNSIIRDTESEKTSLDIKQSKSPSKSTRPLSVAESKDLKSARAGSPRHRSADSANTTKPVNLMSVLRAPSPEKSSAVRNPPLTLSNPSMVAKYSPCTLHNSILPPKLACELFYTMLDAAQGWSRNKWWLFDRLVESPHRTSFFARIEGFELDGDPGETWKEAAQFWYNGRKTDPLSPFPEEMEEACKYIEKVVNEELQKRARFPLEWGGSSGSDGYTWRANVAAANCYEGTKENVGFHSDQLTFLGPYPTIASLSLGTTRLFRLREVIPASEANGRQAQTFNVPLQHNSLIIMHASTQERFKHCVPPQPTIDVFRPPFPRRSVHGASSSSASEDDIPSSNCRINITFRFYRPDFVPPRIPRCKCGVPCILRPDMKRRSDHRDADVKGSGDGKGGKGKSKEKSSSEDNAYHIRYWWSCYSGAQNEGKGCGMWKVMDVKAEGRGPFVGDSEPWKAKIEEGKI